MQRASDASQNRDPSRGSGPRLCGAPLRDAPRPGHARSSLL